MQKNFLLFAVLAIFLGGGNIANATIYRDGNDLVISQEVIRHKDVFDPSIKKDELDPERAMALIAGEAKEFPAAKERGGTSIQKISFWHFPIQISATNDAREFVLKEGKIRKIIPIPEKHTDSSWLMEGVLRIIPVIGITMLIFFETSGIGWIGFVLGNSPCVIVMSASLEQNGWADSSGGDMAVFLVVICLASIIGKYLWNKKYPKPYYSIGDCL